MTTLFFLLLLIPLYSEISDMLLPNKRLENTKKIKEYGKKSKEEKENRKHEIQTELKNVLGFALTMFLYIILIVIGMIMSSQWILFVILFVIGLISASIKKISKNVIFTNTITVIDSIICVIILFYIIINHFHHLNLVPIDLKGFLSFIGIL